MSKRKNKEEKYPVFVVFSVTEVMTALAETYRGRFMAAGFADDGAASMTLYDDVVRITQTEVYA